MSLNTSKPLVWFITGTSQGFGLELVRAALQRGDQVIATSRQPDKVAAAFSGAQAERLLTLSLDLRVSDAIAAGVKSALERFGRIDVLVNNAGYGLLGALEEVSEKEVAAVFEMNVFGLLRLTQAVLPVMRAQGGGHVVNLSSIGGVIGLPGWGIYNATKFAVEGLSEALAKEAGPLGIGVTLVEPGPFRTDFLGGSVTVAGKVLPEYGATAGQTRKYREDNHGGQQGDPALGAEAIVKAVTSQKPPLHLLLGGLAYQRATGKLEDLRAEYAAWRDVTLATDFKS